MSRSGMEGWLDDADMLLLRRDRVYTISVAYAEAERDRICETRARDHGRPEEARALPRWYSLVWVRNCEKHSFGCEG